MRDVTAACANSQALLAAFCRASRLDDRANSWMAGTSQDRPGHDDVATYRAGCRLGHASR